MNDPTVSLSYFERLHELFDRVSELPRDEREAEVGRVAAEDPQLAEDLRALLEHAARPDSPLDSAALRIPGFRIHRRIGSGGSATVYLADQEHAEFTRKVALKVVDRVVDDDSLRSVREEQRILARLEHPGIARLYDSGRTPAGQHWLAMEYVEGESILQHCDARELSARERIELFLPVLDAVAYAHARGIVHRDLKPANIFVTADGEPRLLDFGIAKISDPTDRDETRTLRRALTPAYASPEQMRGGRITTASDIYSLGVVLRELLGENLDRDTEAVLRKALRERPEERYESATAMARDLRRVLSGTPRLLRRLRVVSAVVIAVLLIAAAWMIANRRREKQLGNELAIYHDAKGPLREGAERLARFDASGARDHFRRAAASLKGRLPEEALAWDGVSRAESLLGETGRAADAARRAHALLAGHADVLPKHEAERLRARALAANHDWNAAIAALEGLFGEQPERVDIGIDLVSTLLACGRTDAADTALGRLRQIAPPNAGGDPRIDLIEAELAMQLSQYQRSAAAAARARDGAAKVQAVALGQRAARVHAETLGRLDRREESRRELAAIAKRDLALGLTGEAANAQLSLGTVLVQYAGPDETRRALEAARDGCARAGDRRCEIMSRTLLAMLDGMAGKFKEAIPAARSALADSRAIGDRWGEGYVLTQLQILYNWADDPAAIKAITEPTLAALRDSGNRRLLLTTLTNVALMAVEALDLEKAEAYIVEAEGLARRVGSQVASASTDPSRGYLEQMRGDYDLARESYTAALEMARRAGVPWNTAHYLDDLAWLEVYADRPGPAAEHAKESMAMFTTVGDLQSARNSEGALAWSEARQGNVAAAKRRVAAMRQAAAEDRSDIARFTMLDVEALVAAASGDWRRAIEIRRQTLALARQWDARGVIIVEQVHLAKALHGAGDRRALEKLVAELLPEVERQGLRGIARDLRALAGS
jgi:tRNA A-37 threonylcarbamoyl transferase component Bud32/tetratricopeptide (TPR) repeat protein